MNMITEEARLDDQHVNLAAAHVGNAGEGHGVAAGDGDEGEQFSTELENTRKTADQMLAQGMITQEEAAEQHEEVERTRRRYEELSPEEKRAVNKRLREQGRRLLERQVSGAPVIPVEVVLDHSRLVPVLETWWAFLNRMSVNMTRFGRSTFDGQKKADTVTKWFEDQQAKFAQYVDAEFDVTKTLLDTADIDIKKSGRTPLYPVVTRPAMKIGVEAFTAYSHDMLLTIQKFDRVMSLYDALVFNRVVDQGKIDDKTNEFINKLRPVGLRGLNTHRKLMLTIQSLN